MSASPQKFPSPSAAAQAAINATGTFMGYVFMARLNGQVYADVSYGNAVAAGAGTPALPMSHNSILHLASCSKVICHAALLAMMEDWQTLATAIQAGAQGPTSTVDYYPILHLPPKPLPTPPPGSPPLPRPTPIKVSVPNWLLPVFSSQSVAQQFIAAGLTSLAPSLTGTIQGFANGEGTISSTATIGAQPGFVGLLQQIAAGVPVPTYNTPFMSLIGQKLQTTAAALNPALTTPYPYAGGIEPTFTLAQLLNHQTTLHQGGLSAGILSQIPSANGSQPAGGTCTFNLWPYMVGLMMDYPGPPGYNNNNYTTLGAVIAECTGMDYGQFTIERLFNDPRFSTIRLGPGPQPEAYYYGSAPNFGAGVEACNYTNNDFGAGGFFASSYQFTDWLYALYSCDPTVKNWNGVGPSLSSANSTLLFDKGTGTFPTDWDLWAAPDSTTGWLLEAKSGGTGWSAPSGSPSGSANSVIGIAVSPDNKEVMTAFFATNCSYNAWGAWQPGVTAAIQYYQG